MKRHGSTAWVQSRLWFGFATGVLGISSAAHAFVAAPQPESLTAPATQIGIHVVRPELVQPPTESLRVNTNGIVSKIKADKLSGATRLISGKSLHEAVVDHMTAGLDDYIALAHSYVTAHAQELGASVQDLRLNQDSVLLDRDVQFLTFNVYREGLPVQDASLKFRFKRGKLVQVVNETYAEVANDTRPAMGGLERAVEGALVTKDLQPVGDKLRIDSDASGYRMVRVTEFDARTQDGKRFLVQVEAATGKVFEIRPTEFMLDGTAHGSVYPRYYGDSAQVLPYRDANLANAGGSVVTDAEGHFSGASSSSHPSLDGLAGTRVRVVPETGTKLKASGQSGSDGWDVLYSKGTDTASSDKVMAQSMTYYHLNKEINHAKQYISTAWLDKQLTANVNLSQTCNAYWDGSSVNLFSAGDGCANTALIADVFYHEWGHGLDANTGGIQDGAFSEGFGDTMALIMTHSSVVGKGFIVADGSPVRDMSTFKSYPKDKGAEIHTQGLILGGSFWDLFVSLRDKYGDDQAGDILSTLALKSIFTAHKYTETYDALLVIDSPSGDPSDHSEHYCMINKAFSRHGIAKADPSCN